MKRRDVAFEIAREMGFDAVGIAPLAPPPDAEAFRHWLREGRQAGMAYLERMADDILDPGRGGSILCVAHFHAREGVELPGGGRVARYAAGRDYHNKMGKMLRKLARRLEERGFAGPYRRIVDAGPLMERSHAAEAGLGTRSKATNLLRRDAGPWFFLGELILGEELEPTAPREDEVAACGSCRACLDACPTGALLDGGVLDAGRCISYLTIEHRGPIPPELRPGIGDWAFGCDVCSEVCPWGHRAEDQSERFGTHDGLAKGSLIDWLTNPELDQTLLGSPLRRARREGLARNAAIVLGNRREQAARAALRRAAAVDPSPVVREASEWALRCLDGTVKPDAIPGVEEAERG